MRAIVMIVILIAFVLAAACIGIGVYSLEQGNTNTGWAMVIVGIVCFATNVFSVHKISKGGF